MITILNIVSWTICLLLGLLVGFLVRRKLRAEIAELTKMKASIEDIMQALHAYEE